MKISIRLPFLKQSIIWSHIYLKMFVGQSRSKILCNIYCRLFQRVHTVRPKLGVFSQIHEIQHFCCCLTWLVEKLQQWSLYEVIEDILPLVLNIKRPLNDIWLLSYEQNSLGCFLKKFKFWIFSKTPKTIFLISQQPNIAQRPFCI